VSSSTFAPIPRYDYIDYETRAVPVDGPPLESFPCLESWENKLKTKAFTAEAFRDMFTYEGKDRDRLSEAELRFEEEWLVGHTFSEEAFSPTEPLRESLLSSLGPCFTLKCFSTFLVGTRRDFRGLEALVGALSLDSNKMNALGGRVGAHGYERFAAEDDLEVGPSLRNAFKIFEERVGVSAYQTQRQCVAFSTSLSRVLQR
jgi:hypothetical protein